METLHPNSKVYFLLRTYVILAIIGLFVIYFYFDIKSLTVSTATDYDNIRIAAKNSTLIFSIIYTLLLIPISYFWANFEFQSYRYKVGNTEFSKEHGVINKVYVSIPYNKVQNVEIRRSIFERLLELSTLHIQTAGYHGANGFPSSEGVIPGLEPSVALKLRDEILNKVKKS